ncbi:hypothetical protein MBLNU230_g2438t1 [Neophaeotheca triangularis]
MTDLLAEQMPPAQTSTPLPPDSYDPDMYLNITCDPPLGQATSIARLAETVKFTVLLETDSPSLLDLDSTAKDQPQVCLWHNHGGHHDWSELPLRLAPKKDHEEVMLLNRPGDKQLTKLWFTAELPDSPKHAQVVSFTLKYRLSAQDSWKWIKDSSRLNDGELHYASVDFAKHSTYDLKHFFEGLSGDVKVKSETPETDNTRLYALTCPISPAKGKDSGYSHHQLGRAKDSSRWFALVRLWSPWLAPRQGQGSKFELDKDGVLLSFLRSDGLHVVCLGISGVEDVMATFLNDDHGNVIIKGRNDRESTGAGRVLVAVSDSFEVANAAVMYHARKIVMAMDAALAATEEISTLSDEKVKPQWLEEWYDGFTYCTWNGLGQALTEDKVYHALDELTKNNISICGLILDDNWQSLTAGDSQFQRAWTDFEGNKDGFPNGMNATVTEIRKRHPNIKHIAVWHAILGYWGGVAPDGWIAKNYKTVEVEKEAGVAGGKFTVVAAQDAKRLYEDFYSFLESTGIDSAKTDAQFFLDLLLHAPDRRALTTEYQDAWTVAHLKHFSSRAISCMSQSPQLLFHSQLPTNKPRLLVRNSDDFFPEVPASHPWHIFCNAHNSLLTQHLNVLPDWDMFQTSHPWASFHGAARAISGGPIYFTDEPGKHDFKLIGQMTAQTPRGKTVILRPHTVGKATNPYNTYNERAMLKITTYVGMAKTGTSILGVFNTTQQALSEFLTLSDFPGTESGDYILASFTTGRISKPTSRGQNSAMVGLELPVQGWEIVAAYPLRTFEMKSSKHPVSVSLLGLMGKMTGAAAVTGYDVYVETNGRLRMWTSLKALGVLGVYVSNLADKSLEKDFMVMIFGKPVPVHCVGVSKTSGQVLEIDVAAAWEEMGEDAGWNNEVSLEVFVH